MSPCLVYYRLIREAVDLYQSSCLYGWYSIHRKRVIHNIQHNKKTLHRPLYIFIGINCIHMGMVNTAPVSKWNVEQGAGSVPTKLFRE